MGRAVWRPLTRASSGEWLEPLVAIRKTTLLSLQPPQDWVVNAALPAKEFLLQRGPRSRMTRVAEEIPRFAGIVAEIVEFVSAFLEVVPHEFPVVRSDHSHEIDGVILQIILCENLIVRSELSPAEQRAEIDAMLLPTGRSLHAEH
jgi:hypothetical protein